MQASGKVPALTRRRDLGLGLLAFQEEPPRSWHKKWRRQFEQTRQRRECPRAHHVGPQPICAFREALNAPGVDLHWRDRLARDLGEEGAFLAIALDKMHAEFRPPGFENCDDQPGKAR